MFGMLKHTFRPTADIREVVDLREGSLVPLLHSLEPALPRSHLHSQCFRWRFQGERKKICSFSSCFVLSSAPGSDSQRRTGRRRCCFWLRSSPRSHCRALCWPAVSCGGRRRTEWGTTEQLGVGFLKGIWKKKCTSVIIHLPKKSSDRTLTDSNCYTSPQKPRMYLSIFFQSKFRRMTTGGGPGGASDGGVISDRQGVVNAQHSPSAKSAKRTEGVKWPSDYIAYLFVGHFLFCYEETLSS